MDYTLKIWLTTFLLSPVFIIIVTLYGSTGELMIAASSIYLIMVMCGALFSLPATLVFYFLDRHLQTRLNNLHRKISLSVFTVVGVFTTFVVIAGDIPNASFTGVLWPLCYFAVMVASLWLCKDGRNLGSKNV